MNNQADNLHEAMVSGKLWAATLCAGDHFPGCRPKAEALYPSSRAKADMFITGALDVLGRTNLYVSDNGIITKIERT